MADKYRNKYRIPSARAPWWDYGSNAAYFITICTGNRNHFFGEIINGTMQLSHIGVLADQYWYEIPDHFPFARLDAWQARFYDHIIRNRTAWETISRYIQNNPANWKEDRFHRQRRD